MPSVILAGSSPRRVGLLQLLGYDVDSRPHGIDETPQLRENPRRYAERLAAEKSAAVFGEGAPVPVLGADTVVACGLRILPKAETREQAAFCLNLLSGKQHTVYTAVCVRAPDGRTLRRCSVNKVRVKRLSADELAAYLDSNEWDGKAGGYALQGMFAAFVSHLSGSYHAVLGLPLYEARNLLMSAAGG